MVTRKLLDRIQQNDWFSIALSVPNPDTKQALNPILKNRDCLLFDFDGTLAPNLDLPDMRRRVVELTKQYSVPDSVYNDLYIVEVIYAATNYLKRGANQVAVDYSVAAHQLIKDIELTEAQATDPFEGIPAILRNLRNNAYKIGVVTRNCREAVLSVFPDLLNFIDCLIARDDTKHLKPDVRHLEQAIQKMESTKQEAVIIGDGRLDMECGKRLGLACIGVLSGSDSERELGLAGADLILNSCLEMAP